MTVAQLLVILAQNLPAIIKMLHALAEGAEKDLVDKKVKDDIEAITKAFKEKDAAALNRIFNS
jgi:hypothetical protein